MKLPYHINRLQELMFGSEKSLPNPYQPMRQIQTFNGKRPKGGAKPAKRGTVTIVWGKTIVTAKPGAVEYWLKKYPNATVK